MTEQNPSIGRIVHYVLTEGDAAKMNARYDDAQRNVDAMRADRPGFQAHAGNHVVAGEAVPMIIVKVWPDSVNGQALLDGNDSLWVTSVHEGDGPGKWSWPPRT